MAGNRKFYVLEHLIWHYGQFHASEDYRCSDCHQQFDRPKEFGSHLAEEHNIGEFHCLHCRLGTNDLKKIRLHMADKHSTEHMFIISRHYRLDYTPNEVTK